MPDADKDALAVIEERLGYRFLNRTLLLRALTHTSYAHEHSQSRTDPTLPRDHYERLEFLGDAVLALVTSDLLIDRCPDATEGELSRTRAGMVNADRLAELSRSLEVGPALRLGNGEESTGGRHKNSILADAYESILGAIYLDGGFDRAREVAFRHFEPLVETLPFYELLCDYKTPLQELVQALYKIAPHYRVVRESGPDHMKTFEVEVFIAGESRGRGAGRSKKEAEQAAALEALRSEFPDE